MNIDPKITNQVIQDHYACEKYDYFTGAAESSIDQATKIMSRIKKKLILGKHVTKKDVEAFESCIHDMIYAGWNLRKVEHRLRTNGNGIRLEVEVAAGSETPQAYYSTISDVMRRHLLDKLLRSSKSIIHPGVAMTKEAQGS